MLKKSGWHDNLWAGRTEWAHALAGGHSVWGAEGSIGQRPIVPEAGI